MQPHDLVGAWNSGVPLDEIHRMLREVPDPGATSPHHSDSPLLHLAAAFADAGAVGILLELGADPQAVNSCGETPLHMLAEQKPVRGYPIPPGAVAACAEILLDAGVDPLQQESDHHQTCCHMAARWGRSELVDVLARCGAALDTTDSSGNTALHLCCRYARSAVESIGYAVQQLETRRRSYDEYPKQPLREALQHAEADLAEKRALAERYLRIAQVLLGAGLDPRKPNDSHRTALDLAVRISDKRFGALLSGSWSPADPDSPAARAHLAAGGRTLHQAVEQADPAAISALLDLGADCGEILQESGSYAGMTPLGIACARLDPDTAELLLRLGADPSARDANGRTPLAACLYGTASAGLQSDALRDQRPQKLLEAFARHGLQVDEPVNEDGETLLGLACRLADTAPDAGGNTLPRAFITGLLTLGCDVDRADLLGRTPLMHICAAMRPELPGIQLQLLEAGADMTRRDQDGRTALHWAATNTAPTQGRRMADMLFSFGDPWPDATDSGGKTALELAVEYENEPLVKYLLARD